MSRKIANNERKEKENLMQPWTFFIASAQEDFSIFFRDWRKRYRPIISGGLHDGHFYSSHQLRHIHFRIYSHFNISPWTCKECWPACIRLFERTHFRSAMKRFPHRWMDNFYAIYPWWTLPLWLSYSWLDLGLLGAERICNFWVLTFLLLYGCVIFLTPVISHHIDLHLQSERLYILSRWDTCLVAHLCKL